MQPGNGGQGRGRRDQQIIEGLGRQTATHHQNVQCRSLTTGPGSDGAHRVAKHPHAIGGQVGGSLRELGDDGRRPAGGEAIGAPGMGILLHHH